MAFCGIIRGRQVTVKDGDILIDQMHIGRVFVYPHKRMAVVELPLIRREYELTGNARRLLWQIAQDVEVWSN
jgi:hypothetical protein